jgi:predicted MFS family arabinose efflux permease
MLVLVLSVGITTLSLLQTLVVPALGAIAEQLHVPPGAAGWVTCAASAR